LIERASLMTDMRLPGAPISVLVVDDHALVGTVVASGLRDKGLQAQYCAATSVGEILAAAAARPRGVALLDLDLGRDEQGDPIDGVDLIEPLRAAGWRVLVLSGTADPARVGACLAAGAQAAVAKHAPFPVLLRAVCEIAAGRVVMSPSRCQQLIELHHRQLAERRALREKLSRLTLREREVLAGLARGRRPQTIADMSSVSLTTVRSHIQAVLTKLEVGSQLEAVALYDKLPPR
jgi:DNA-binding NarL/FixJ family response regulator